MAIAIRNNIVAVASVNRAHVALQRSAKRRNRILRTGDAAGVAALAQARQMHRSIISLLG